MNTADFLATSLRQLSNRLAELGRREEALAAIQESVTICRELAAARPEAFQADLGTSRPTSRSGWTTWAVR